MEATGRIVGWLFVAAVVFVALRGSLPTYVSLLGA
jgi:hypothetical protein